MKKIFATILCTILIVLCSCSEKAPSEQKGEDVFSPVVSDKTDENGAEEMPQPEIEEPDTPVEPEVEKTEISKLTGLPITVEESVVRPVAVVLNNHKKALPQAGIGDADVVWEFNMEGGITRLVALYSDISKVGELGAVRSARDYFLDAAGFFDAILVHAGASEYFYAEDKASGYDNIDEVNMHSIPSDTFWRNSEKRYSRGYEHCLETSGEKLVKAFESQNYKTDTDLVKSPFDFYSEFTVPDGKDARVVTLAHSSYITPRFTYNADDHRYYKESYDSPHIDETTGEAVAFENLIVLFASQKVIDDYLRLDIDLERGGEGILISAGKSVDIKWSRSGTSLVLTTDGGDDVMLNPGKTHITVFDKSHKNGITIK